MPCLFSSRHLSWYFGTFPFLSELILFITDHCKIWNIMMLKCICHERIFTMWYQSYFEYWSDKTNLTCTKLDKLITHVRSPNGDNFIWIIAYYQSIDVWMQILINIMPSNLQYKPHQIPEVRCSRLALQLYLRNPLKSAVQSRNRRQATLQVHLSDQQFYCLLRCGIYYLLSGTFITT